MKIGDKLYRVYDGEVFIKLTMFQIKPDSIIGEPVMTEFRVTKLTPKGYYAGYSGPYSVGDRFCLNDAYRRFAYPTEDEAINSYRIRKKRHIQHATKSLNKAQCMLDNIHKLEIGN